MRISPDLVHVKTSDDFKQVQDEAWNATEAEREAAEKAERARWDESHPPPSAAKREAARADHERLTTARAEAEATVAEASAALAATEALVATITAKIVSHDGGDGIEKLAAERAVAVARKEALAARLSDRMTVLSAAKAAVTAAERALDDELLVAAKAEHVAAIDALEKRLRTFAKTVVRDLGNVERLWASASEIFTRVQTAKGVQPEYQRGVDPGALHRPDLIAAAFASFLLAAVHESPVPR
jgi:hypothetical protein